jgi:hypothetical protein
LRRVLLFLLLLTLPLAADPPPSAGIEEDFPLEGTIRIGPFRFRPYLQIQDTGYDDNVFLDSTERVSDYTSTVAPGIRLITLFSDRAGLLIEERADYVWFARSESQNHLNNFAKARASFYLKRVTLFTEIDGISVRERPSTEIDFRIRRHEYAFSAGARYERTRTSFEARLGRDDFRFVSGAEGGENIPSFLNRVEKRLTLTARRRILPKTTILAEWHGREIGFDEPEGAVKDSSARRISAGFEFDPTAFIKGTVKAGVESLEPDLPSEKGFRGTVGEGTLLYRITGATVLEVRGRRYPGFTTAVNNVYFLNTSYGATLTQRLADRVAAEIGGDNGRVGYPVGTVAFDPTTGQTVSGFREDELRTRFVGASYRLSNQARIGIRVGVWERDSTFGFLDRRRNTAQVTYVYNF